ncbi:MAG: hypothetical protein AN484_25520 [Aphanizomenon flos-aquae WA102]|uniref:5'-Nucleotidase C-terminal domain-containing protein n=1 Tax=Aphanizomenon flos-aquae WA102 TaxID=1710896 RepID=A0A1B7WI41_APHFL|nr:MAG: hypothetical protein AN484_25520 [Aphanizomenon flos-aquae WA102]
MGEVLAHSNFNLIAQRPSSSLMNWVADAVFANQTKTVRLSTPTFCLLNTGGIRNTLNIGDITLGDMFKLMPFDIEIVWVQFPAEVLPEIERAILKSGALCWRAQALAQKRRGDWPLSTKLSAEEACSFNRYNVVTR